jgi:hypothetical protein
MATNKRFGRKMPSWANRDTVVGARVDSGPFIGFVKNNFDPTRSGRLQVWIPELGGDENSPTSWRTISYASPYSGTTYREPSNRGSNNSFDQVAHSYGMWAVPPDIDCQVICTFIAGDPNRGYWFACVNTDLSHYMVPGLASASQVDNQFTPADLAANYDASASNWPVTEFNEFIDNNNSPGFIQNKKPVHTVQTGILIEQGLDRDRARGAVTSSSQRESPSTVFGISTPGRPVNDPADDPEFQAKMLAGTLTTKDVMITSRKGGHTFVMDDGDQQGGSQLVRLRTAGGHQILLNDSDDIIYIANNTGTAWIEFNSAGQISAYSQAGLNLRTEGDFNLHSDANININAAGNINMFAGTAIAQQTLSHSTKATTITAQATSIGLLSTGGLNLQGASGGFKISGDLVLKGGKIYLNSQSPADIDPVPDLTVYHHRDTTTNANGLWQSVENVYESIATVTPAHEPWPRVSTATGKDLSTVTAPAPKQTALSNGKAPTDPGPVSAKGKPVFRPAPISAMTSRYAPRPDGCPPPNATIPGLLPLQLRAILVQIGWAESGYEAGDPLIIDYNKIDAGAGYIGGYQINGALLQQFGYVTNSSDIFSTLSWTGKDGIYSVTDWLNHMGIQEYVMEQILQQYYTDLVNQRAIKPGDDVVTVAGMVAAAYFFRDAESGAVQAGAWRNQAVQTNNQGQPGYIGYNWGRYAIEVLVAQTISANQAPVSGPSASGIDPASVINFTNGSGDLAHYNMLGSSIKTSFEKMAKEFLSKTGRKITISSAIRTMAEQTALYNGWLAAGGSKSNRTVTVPGYGKVSMPAVPSSNSPHVKGIAIDIARADIQDAMRLGILGEYNFIFPFGASDPVHIQYNA